MFSLLWNYLSLKTTQNLHLNRYCERENPWIFSWVFSRFVGKKLRNLSFFFQENGNHLESVRFDQDGQLPCAEMSIIADELGWDLDDSLDFFTRNLRILNQDDDKFFSFCSFDRAFDNPINFDKDIIVCTGFGDTFIYKNSKWSVMTDDCIEIFQDYKMRNLSFDDDLEEIPEAWKAFDYVGDVLVEIEAGIEVGRDFED